MRYKLFFIILFVFIENLISQTLNLNESHIENFLRYKQLKNELNSDITFSLKPLNINSINSFKDEYIPVLDNYAKTIYKNTNETIELKILPLNYNIEFNSHHPYNRNNGSMIPNKGYQHIISPGIFFKIGPIHIQLKPEHLFSQNLSFDGFSENHYPQIWAERYETWNKIDAPERFGNKRHNNILFQKNLKN